MYTYVYIILCVGLTFKCERFSTRSFTLNLMFVLKTKTTKN